MALTFQKISEIVERLVQSGANLGLLPAEKQERAVLDQAEQGLAVVSARLFHHTTPNPLDRKT
jgi:hypothetical protein